MRYMVRPVERAVERIDAAKQKKRKNRKNRFASNYATFNALLPMTEEAKREREAARNLLLAMFEHRSNDAEREERGMMNLAAALGLELKPRAPRLRW